MTPAVWGVPNASNQGTKSELAHNWVNRLHNRCPLGGPQRFTSEKNVKSGREVGDWLHNPCLLGGPQRFTAGDKINSGPQVGGLATYLPQFGGVPDASKRGTTSAPAHKWVNTLHNRCGLGAPQRFRVCPYRKKKKSRPVRGNFKRGRGQYMSSPRCSQLFNHESLAPNWSQHITI